VDELSTGVTATPDSGASSAADSPTASQGSGAPSGQSSADVQSQPVQGQAQTQPSDDPLSGFPSDDELSAAVANKTPFAEQASRIKSAYQPLKTQFDELSQRFTPYESVLGRFERPEQLQESLDIYDGLIGWEQGPQGLEPATEKGVQAINEKFPLHADFIAADLLRMESVDPETGQRMPRIDIALKGMATDPTERAKVAKMFGLVEPSSISPQWQPTEDQLAVVKPELQDIFKSLPYDEREKLSVNDPDFINSQLAKEKLTRELMAEREQTQTREQQRVQQREQYVRQQAEQAGNQYVQTQLTDALTTFHNSVVEQCNFIQQLDPANLPQGMTAEQATQMNQQIASSNQAEAAQITLAVVGLVNPETRPFVLPLLKQIGVVDDKLMKEIDEAADKFGNNGRNYGHLEYRGKMSANGNGYQPDVSVTTLKNNSSSGLKLLIHTANQIKKNLMEKRSQFFQMKATDHNSTLNSTATSRPSPNGTTFNPATAAQPRPQGFMSRQEINQQFGG
jgi:hypothetical protein